jgi:hypothetical protein
MVISYFVGDASYASLEFIPNLLPDGVVRAALLEAVGK